MSLFISSVFTYDEDAGNYIQAVETADAQALEPATRKAINNFVIGCKQDGIWTAIKASCILAGARTLAGALVPLVGAAPTNNNFVAGDYNRKTGLVGDGSTKYLNSNRTGTADPQNNIHASVYVSTAGAKSGFNAYFGTTAPVAGSFNVSRTGSTSTLNVQCNSSNTATSLNGAAVGVLGIARASGASFVLRASNTSTVIAQSSDGRSANTNSVFRVTGAANTNSNARLAFYSIGESLDLARLDARVTDLINAFAVTIP